MFLNQICKSRFTTEPKNNNINKNIRHISLLQCHIEICDYLLHTFLEINLEKHIAASWGSASCNSYVNLELKHLGKVHHHNVKKVREYFESISIKNFYIIDMAEQFTTKFATVNKVNMSPITFIQNMQHYTKRGINFCKVIHEQSINYLAKLPILTEHQRLCIRYQRAMLEALQTTTSLILMQNNLKTMGETNEVSNSNTKKYQTETSNMRGGNPKVQINNVNIQFTSNNNIYLNQSNVQLINNNKHKSITNSNNSQLMIAKTQIPSVKFQSTSTTRAKPTNNSIVYNDLCKNPLLLCNNTTTTTYSAAEVKRNHKTTNNKQIDVYQQILCQAKNTNATITHTPPVRHSNLINNVGTAKFQNPNILNSQNDIPTTVNDLFTESDEYSIEKFLSDINNLQSAYLNQTNVIDMQNRTNGNHSILELNPTRNDEHPIRIEANLNRIEVNPNRIEGNLNRIEVNPDSIEINPNRIEGNPNRIEGNLNRIEINTNGIEENFNRIQRSSSRNEVTPNSIEINPNRILLNPVRNEVNLIENENRFENVNEIGIEISTSSIEVNQDRIEEKQSGNEEKLNGNEEKELGNEKSVSRDEETSTKQDASKETIKVNLCILTNIKLQYEESGSVFFYF